jgi:hypothetical protein
MKANYTVAAILGGVCGGLAHAASAAGSATPAPAVRRILRFPGLPSEPACPGVIETHHHVCPAGSERADAPLRNGAPAAWRHLEPSLGAPTAPPGDALAA